ncbi:hypothetical protein BDR06DRAFT_673694 [Suillus hirtellus]|nr:hypothetical protein BDR06DRAFT_673694 [Suillus hirtellus]
MSSGNGPICTWSRLASPIHPKTGLARYDNDFFGNESDHAYHRATPVASQSSLIRWRCSLSSIHFGTRPVNAPQPIERQSQQWNVGFKLFSGGRSMRTIDVPLAQDENRIGIVPESDAEAATAMQRTNSHQADSSTQSGQLAGAQPSQAQPIQTEAQELNWRSGRLCVCRSELLRNFLWSPSSCFASVMQDQRRIACAHSFQLSFSCTYGDSSHN